MKLPLLIVFISSCLFSFGQTNMFWNNYSNSNPAMSGFEFQRHGALTAIQNSKWFEGVDLFQANYSQRIYGQHGVGINFNGYYQLFSGQSITLNYNYQFDFNKAGKLSAGIGIGASHVRIRDKYSDFLDSGQVFTPRNNFLLTIGATYSWKNLLVGISTSDLTVSKPPNYSSVYYPLIRLNAFISYDFQVTQNFELTPRIKYQQYNNGFNPFISNLTATFYEKYAVGISFYPNNQLGLNLGWDISNKFRVAYMVSQTVFKDFPWTYAGYYRTHEFSIGYIIKNPKQPFHCGSSPR